MYPTKLPSGTPCGPEPTPPADRGLDRSALMALCARQETEIDSLCAEILARYEEATFVYRLGEQIGSVQGERAIARLVVREAAATRQQSICRRSHARRWAGSPKIRAPASSGRSKLRRHITTHER